MVERKKKREEATVEEKSPPDFRWVGFRLRGVLKEKLEEEMKQKEIDNPQSIVMSALRKRYGLETA
jgi:hypothetical protein